MGHEQGPLKEAKELGWLVDDLVTSVAHVRHVVLLSSDGLPVAGSKELSKEDTDHLAAVAAGFQSLARGAGRHFGGGGIRQSIVEMDEAFLFVTAAGQGTCLAVLSAPSADVGVVAYEMAALVTRVGAHLERPARPGAG